MSYKDRPTALAPPPEEWDQGYVTFAKGCGLSESIGEVFADIENVYLRAFDYPCR